MQKPHSQGKPRARLHLKEHRERRLSWSQIKAAQMIGVHAATVWRWETGAITTIRPYDLQMIADAYGLDYDALAAAENERRFSSEMPVLTWDLCGTVEAFRTLEDSPMDQHPLTGLRAGNDLTGLARDWLTADPAGTTHHTGSPHVDLVLVEQLEGMVLRLRHLDDEIGGADLLPLVRQRYQRLTSLLEGSYTSTVGQRLLATAADLGQLLGWLAFDTGLHGFAQRQWIAALQAARSAGDDAMGANILAGLAMQSYHLGRPQDGLSLAQTADEGLGPAGSPTVRAMLSCRQAVAAAKSGDRATSATALNRAETLLGREDPDAPSWMYYYGRADEQLHAGTCWQALGDLTRAETCFQDVLDSIDVTHIRDRGIVLSRIALLQIGRNEIEIASATASDALNLHASQLNSLRTADELAEVDQALTAFTGSVPAASDFHEKYISLLATSLT